MLQANAGGRAFTCLCLSKPMGLCVRKRVFAPLELFLLLLTFAPLSSANPFICPGISLQPIPSGSGARALGQGNAFIGVADDATAASWNPGGLAQLESPEISFAIESIRLRSKQNYPGHREAETATGVHLHNLNYLSVVQPLRLGGRHAVVSLNYLKQYHFDRALDHQRNENPVPIFRRETNVTERGSGSLAVLAPALAIDVSQKLSLGMALNIWNDSLTGNSRFQSREEIQALTTITPDPFVNFNQVENKWCKDTFVVRSGYSLTLGGLYRLNNAWSFGLVLKPPYYLRLKHEATSFAQGTVITPHTQKITFRSTPSYPFPGSPTTDATCLIPIKSQIDAIIHDQQYVQATLAAFPASFVS